MGFNKRYVPVLEVVKKQLEEMGVKDFINYYTKPDALIGSKESMIFIDSIVEEDNQRMTSKNTSI